MPIVNETNNERWTMNDFFQSDGEYLAKEDGGFLSRVILDSKSKDNGKRLTTLELTFPRFVLSEFNTHRLLSKNSASSRAIPTHKQIAKLLEDPFVPSAETVRYNQGGMQGHTVLTDEDYADFVRIWKMGRSRAVLTAMELILGEKEVEKAFGVGYTRLDDIFLASDTREAAIDALKEHAAYTLAQRKETGSVEQERYLNVHKQTANRVIEPYVWHVVITSGTEWDNFWYLREDIDADPQIHKIAKLAHETYNASTPQELEMGQWHTPFVRSEEKAEAENDYELWKKVSSGRCARVSYETHSGVRDLSADEKLHSRLVTGKPHLSPLEHVATPMESENDTCGNFRGWFQHRKEVVDSQVF